MKLLFICLFVYTHAQVDRDWSFQAMCEFWNGKPSYRERDGYSAMIGDKCTFRFQASTDDESAKSYCEQQVPFHIKKAIPTNNYETLCEAEATLICDWPWVQLFGRCYKIQKQLMTRHAAEEYCSKNRTGSTIAFMHREALPYHINNYFTSVSRVWLDASEAVTNGLIHDVPGGNLLLALDGYRYNLPNIALARVDPSETAMVLCEYTPRMTQAESSYLLDRYGEVYHPTVRTSEGSYVRTASSLNRNENDNMADNNYCTKVMMPFVPNGKAQSAIPTQEFLNEVNEVNKADRGLIIRTSAFSKNYRKSERMKNTCAGLTAASFHMFFKGKDDAEVSVTIDDSVWRDGKPTETCDAASWSSALVLSRKDPRLEAMSDARYAPIYCQSITDTYSYGPCTDGFTDYYRKDLGQKWCHKFFPIKKDYDEAEQQCQTMGAHLTGYTDKSELDFLDKLMTESGAVFGATHDTWLGAKRRAECITVNQGTLSANNKMNWTKGGFEDDQNDPCSRLRVFEWLHGVAPNPPKIESDWATPYEPNFFHRDETCLTLLKGASNYWYNNMDATKKLNDISCRNKFYFICGKEAPIVKTS